MKSQSEQRKVFMVIIDTNGNFIIPNTIQRFTPPYITVEENTGARQVKELVMGQQKHFGQIQKITPTQNQDVVVVTITKPINGLLTANRKAWMAYEHTLTDGKQISNYINRPADVKV